MRHKDLKSDDYLQDAGFQDKRHENRPVLTYRADRKSGGLYLALIAGFVLALGMMLYALGQFGSRMQNQTGMPGVDKAPATTGQNGASR